MNEPSGSSELNAHLQDLQNRCIRRGMNTASFFLNEEEQAAAQKSFPESSLIRYDGGYPGARKKKVIFLNDEEDDFSDIACMQAETDQRFVSITHSDILGALMSLQIDRHVFGDFWAEESRIILYTSQPQVRFFSDQLTRISSLSVSFHETEERPVQIFHTRRFQAVVASARADALTAALAHCSRSQAVEMIRSGLVQINHEVLVKPEQICNNNCTISIRGVGRFTYIGAARKTRTDRTAADFLQDL